MTGERQRFAELQYARAERATQSGAVRLGGDQQIITVPINIKGPHDIGMRDAGCRRLAGYSVA